MVDSMTPKVFYREGNIVEDIVRVRLKYMRRYKGIGYFVLINISL